MAVSTPVILPKKSQEAFIEYYRSVQSTQNATRNEQRNHLENVDRAYQREQDKTQEQLDAKAANTVGDTRRHQNITVPVVMPQVESAVEYQASVFLTGHPIFGVVADPQFMDQAMQMETILEDQSIRGGWVRELSLHFRDGFKYNFAPIEVEWADEVSYAVETDVNVSLTEGVPKEVIWSGNKLKRLDPYNTFVDRTVTPSEVYKKGEYAGYTEFMSRIELKAFVATLPDKIIANIKPAFESGTGGSGTGAQNAGALNYYIPDINPSVNEVDNKFSGTNWLRWAGISDYRNQNIDYKDSYEVTRLYCRILPSEFNLKVPKSSTPQIYKLIIVNHEHIIYAERQTNAHNYLPILIGMPQEDGLDYQTKSLGENSIPFQQVATTYMTSIIASRRRAISDRVLYDPSRITSAAINSPNPSAKIPIRPSAYGKNVSDSVYAFPYREDQQAANMQQISTILGMANTLAGQNQVSQGQFVKGNKTVHEFESTMRNANGRDQMVAMLLESQVFTPMKHILKINILQFQSGTTIYNRERAQQVEIDPVALRKAVMDFTVTDGLIPADKVINGESFGVALQVLGSSPQIAQEYNVGQLFSYFMKTQGAMISAFEKSAEQVAYEQAVTQWQQVVAMAIENEQDPASIGPQPLPEQFGYVPAQNDPGAPAPEGAAAGSAPTAPAAPTAAPQAA